MKGITWLTIEIFLGSQFYCLRKLENSGYVTHMTQITDRCYRVHLNMSWNRSHSFSNDGH